MAEKRHMAETLTDELCLSSNNMDWNNGVPTAEQVASVYTLLKVLKKAEDIPATIANGTATRLVGLPEKLRGYKRQEEARLAQEVIDDLKSRVDDPPQSLHAAKAQSIADAMNDGLDEDIPDSRDFH